MRKIVTLTIILLLFIILDNALIPFFSIKGIFPSLVFVFSICYSIINGYWEAFFIGISAGVLQDIYFVNAFGINSLTNMLICILAAEVGRNIFKDKIFIPVLTTFVLSIMKNVLIFIVFYILKVGVYNRTILYSSIYNMVIAIPMYIFVLHLSSKNYMKREWKF